MLNKVMLIGRLGADPEVRYMPSGGAVTNIRLATTVRWKDRQSGERKESTEWHRIVFFNRLAEIAGEYLRKGSQTYIEGRLQTRKWQGQDGQDRYATEVIATEMTMLGSRPASAPSGQAASQAPPARNPPPSQSSQQDSLPEPPPVQAFDDDFDDDIPF